MAEESPESGHGDAPARGAETDERFPSGAWVGFWLQRGLSGRQWMRDLWLHFGGGRVSGAGRDWVGDFLIRGTYEVEAGAVRLWKQYVGEHVVTYEGRNEGDGKWVWGVWRIV